MFLHAHLGVRGREAGVPLVCRCVGARDGCAACRCGDRGLYSRAAPGGGTRHSAAAWRATSSTNYLRGSRSARPDAGRRRRRRRQIWQRRPEKLLFGDSVTRSRSLCQWKRRRRRVFRVGAVGAAADGGRGAVRIPAGQPDRVRI